MFDEDIFNPLLFVKMNVALVQFIKEIAVTTRSEK